MKRVHCGTLAQPAAQFGKNARPLSFLPESCDMALPLMPAHYSQGPLLTDTEHDILTSVGLMMQSACVCLNLSLHNVVTEL